MDLLPSIDIQRGRDHGVPYGEVRGRIWVGSNVNYSDGPQAMLKLQSDSPAPMDNRIRVTSTPTSAYLADHLPDSALGRLMDAVIRDQFILDCEMETRLYYENDPELEGVEQNLSETKLSHIISQKSTTEIQSIQCNVFFAGTRFGQHGLLFAQRDSLTRG